MSGGSLRSSLAETHRRSAAPPRSRTHRSPPLSPHLSPSLCISLGTIGTGPLVHAAMSFLLITVLSSLVVHRAEAWGANVKYAVNCPDRCNPERCGGGGGGGGTQRCARTVLDDCGCCQVCAAGRGEHCYRTVSGMHGVKCGPGLFCEFYKDEDDYGDEYGICKDCLYGTYGVECRKTCNCKGGICDRETGACLTLSFFAKIASKLKTEPQTGAEVGSGEISTVHNTDQLTDRSTAPKRLNPR
ncbi:unnamed protein product [Ophioblennius macclurei]